jgi:hypothetical protein
LSETSGAGNVALAFSRTFKKKKMLMELGHVPAFLICSITITINN